MIFERHVNLKYKYGNRYFGCRGYHVDTVGRNAKKIQEYIDPFTGDPVNQANKRSPVGLGK